MHTTDIPMASGCRNHMIDEIGCGDCLGTLTMSARQEVMAIQEQTARIQAIRAEMAEEATEPLLCRCGAELFGDCNRCNDEDEEEALGERDGEMADDMRRFGC